MAKITLPVRLDPLAIKRGLADPCNSNTDQDFRHFLARADALVSAFTGHLVGIFDLADIDWWSAYEDSEDRTLETVGSQRAVLEALAEGDHLFKDLLGQYDAEPSDG